MKIKNETEIQLMKILFKTSGKKPTKNITSQRAYPHGVEMKYFRQLKGFFKPLTDYVNKYINENLEPLLRGDSTEIHLDTIPGQSFRSMIYNLENWLSIYMPDISDLSEDSNNNVILTSLGKTADEAKEFGDKEFQKIIEKGIHVSVPTSSPWWNDMKSSWAENNYTLITSNAKKYVEQINNLTEQAIVNGLSPAKLKEQIKKATEGLSDKHCKLLARDQMGKLNGNITEAQMQEIGLDLYVWSTAYDDRVRDSHALMEGLLCRWDDASVCSYDNGKTWVERPSGAVDLHPGQDIQCRCVPLAFYPELESEVENVGLEDTTENLPPVRDLEILSEDEISNIKDINKANSIYDKLNNEYKSLLDSYRSETDEKIKEEILQKGKKIANLKDIAEVRKNVLETIGRIPNNYEEIIQKLEGVI
jgi:SPP1 gp7 family putative phage head morphogenesis protein